MILSYLFDPFELRVVDCVSQTNIIGATAADRNILLYDTRGSAPLRKVIILSSLFLTIELLHLSFSLSHTHSQYKWPVFQDNLCKPVPEYQTIWSFIVVRDDESDCGER